MIRVRIEDAGSAIGIMNKYEELSGQSAAILMDKCSPRGHSAWISYFVPIINVMEPRGQCLCSGSGTERYMRRSLKVLRGFPRGQTGSMTGGRVESLAGNASSNSQKQGSDISAPLSDEIRLSNAPRTRK